VWSLDPGQGTASLALNVQLGGYSDAWGSAQKLANGNYFFGNGKLHSPTLGLIGQSVELRPDGARSYVLEIQTGLYRAYRHRTLYAP
jgi:hypothetical protein